VITDFPDFSDLRLEKSDSGDVNIILSLKSKL